MSAWPDAGVWPHCRLVLLALLLTARTKAAPQICKCLHSTGVRPGTQQLQGLQSLWHSCSPGRREQQGT